MSTANRSYLAMLLSVFPGLGQLYLRKPLKGLVLFLGVLSAAAVIYISSLPVNDWRDLVRFDELRTWWQARQTEKTAGRDSEKTEPNATNGKETKYQDYHLYTFDDNLLFYIGLNFHKELDRNIFSKELQRALKDNGVLLSKDAVISTEKTDSRWKITHGNRAYVIRKMDGRLNVYAVKKLMYRPSWKFKISGFMQGIILWVYAIFDAWRGRRGFNRRALKKMLKQAERDKEIEREQYIDDSAKG